MQFNFYFNTLGKNVLLTMPPDLRFELPAVDVLDPSWKLVPKPTDATLPFGVMDWLPWACPWPCSLLLIEFLIAVCISSFYNPTRVNRSDIKLPLTLKSRWVSVFSEGDRLTSRSQGLKFSSTKISKPSSSKQLLFFIFVSIWLDVSN